MAHEVVLAAAYSSGVAVAFSPCATALLPAYLSYYMSRTDEGPNAQAEPEPPDLPSLLKLGLAGVVAGLGLFVLALVAWIFSFGEWNVQNISLLAGGGLALAVGGFITWEGVQQLELAERRHLRAQLLKGLVIGGMASLGIGAVYVALGVSLVLAIQAGLRGFQELLPRIAFVSAGLVVVLGVLMFFNKGITSIIPRLRAPRGRKAPAFFLFGAGYALIASGCFFPIFISVITAALTFGTAESLQVFLSYALGSATVFMLISLSASAAQGAAFRALRAWRPYVHRIGGLIVVAMGLYVMWFDWTFVLSQGL